MGKLIAKCPGCGHAVVKAEKVNDWNGFKTLEGLSYDVVWEGAPKGLTIWASRMRIKGTPIPNATRWVVGEPDKAPGAVKKSDGNGLTDEDHERAEAIADTPLSRRKKADKEFLAAYREKVRGTRKS